MEVAWAASRKKGSYFQKFFYRLAARRGRKKAIVALAHKLLCLVYRSLREGNRYQEPNEEYQKVLEQEALEKRLVQRLKALGYQVELKLQTSEVQN